MHAARRDAAVKAKLGSVRWHTFHHTYRSLLDDTGTLIGVQQKLMRHADIGTTMKYGHAYMPSKHAANSKVPTALLT